MKSSKSWRSIESDPVVYTHLIRAFGARGVQVEELSRVWDFEEDIFANLRPVHGLIFMFKRKKEEPPSGPIITSGEALERIYFAHQAVHNASPTQAIINLLLNCMTPDLELGKELTRLKELNKYFDPGLAGQTIADSQVIRAAHNSMSPVYLNGVQKPSPEEAREVYHFICYMPVLDRLYELDGLRAGPIDHGPLLYEHDWDAPLLPVLRTRMNKYMDGKIPFNVMAVVSNRKMVLEMRIHRLLTFPPMVTDWTWNEVRRLRRLMAYEEIKERRYEKEMERRLHSCHAVVAVERATKAMSRCRFMNT